MSYRSRAGAIISSYVRVIRKHYGGVRTKKQDKALHQLRVYSRRLRNALWIFKDLFDKKQLKSWNRNIKAMVEPSSSARDIDVFISFLRKHKNQLRSRSQRDCLNVVLHRLAERRKKIHPQIVRALSSFEKKKTLRQITVSLRAAAAGPEEARSKKIYKVGRKRVVKRIRHLLNYEPFVVCPEKIHELHQMRIAAKKLRYTLESLRRIYGTGIDRYVDVILKFHRQLGEIHDYDVWVAQINTMKPRNRKMTEQRVVLERLCRHLQSRRQKAYVVFVRAWKTARKNRTLDKLVEYVYTR